VIELMISTQGLIRAMYTEVIPIQTFGRVQIARASHVEPDATGNWWADLRPSQGPILGPFPLRSAALQAERDWLTQHVLLGPISPSQNTEPIPHETNSAFEIQQNAVTTASGSLQTGAGDSDVRPPSTAVPVYQHAPGSAGQTRPEFAAFR
jgi:hypothetical protein